MPNFNFTGSAVLPEPIIEVYIDNARVRGVIVPKGDDSSGIDPSAMTLLFPSRDYSEHPCQNNAQVRVYVNRQNHPTPAFRGYVTGFGDHIPIGSNQYVEVFCLDEIIRLQETSVTRDYNTKDTRDEYSEQLTIRQIAHDIRLQVLSTLGASAPTIMDSSFPLDFPGEMNLLSQPVNTALATLLDQASDYKYSIRRVYTETQTLIYAYKVGYGETADIIIGSDLTSGPQNQPSGVANVGEARAETNYVDVVNKARVLGDRKVIETALALAPAWNAAKETLLRNIDVYTNDGSDDSPNPDYDPEAERLGRAFRFGTVNTGRFAEYPDLEARLLQRPPYGYTAATADFCKPFVVYKFVDDVNWRVTFDFQIKDNEVMTEKPLLRSNITEGPTIDIELPSQIYLECAYKLRDQLTVTTAKQGGVRRTVTRDFSKPEYKYKYEQNFFRIGLAAQTPNGTILTTSDNYLATFVAGPSITSNDTALANTWAVARLKAMSGPRDEVTYELPRMDLNYAVGQRVRENGQYRDVSISGIEYTLQAPFKTTITAVSPMSGQITAQAYEQTILQLRAAQREISRLNALKASVPPNQRYQQVKPARITVANADNTFDVLVIAGFDRFDTNWTFPSVISADPDAAFGAGDIVMLVINPNPPHYIITGGGSGESTVDDEPHAHDSIPGRGYAGFLSGGR